MRLACAVGVLTRNLGLLVLMRTVAFMGRFPGQ